MTARHLTPEILDHLPADDPEAIRARKDLRRINHFMGNYSWITNAIPKDSAQISELGSGDGELMMKLAAKFPKAQLHAHDLAPRPKHLPPEIKWHQQDILKLGEKSEGGVLIANLILHHFTEKELAKFSSWIRSFDTIIINEPLRWPTLILMGKLASPLINRVTRHDMRVSIEAGFTRSEIPEALGLNPHEFKIIENCTWRGSQRVLASRA